MVLGPEDASKICYKCKKVGHLSRDCQENSDESLQSTANGGDGHSLTSAGNAANDRDRIVMEEEDIHEIGEEEKEKLNDVDYLTGNPLPNDILLYAVPVCGPYNALQSYKYRVKLVPGTVKKGKGNISCCHCFFNLWQLSKVLYREVKYFCLVVHGFWLIFTFVSCLSLEPFFYSIGLICQEKFS